MIEVPNAVQLPMQFDVKRLKEEVDAIPADQWQENFSLYAKPGHLYLCNLAISAPFDSPPGTPNVIPTKLLEQSPYLMEIFQQFPGEKNLFRLQTMKAGGTIQLHKDGPLNYASGLMRIHIPITTNSEVYFTLEGERVVMLPGECWYVDVSRTHELCNKGTADRTHLIIDCLVNSWWEKQLMAVLQGT